jgi:tRNA(fMet)-specific endonuclease VapC
MLKRLLGAALRARPYWSQCREIILRSLTLNIMILWYRRFSTEHLVTRFEVLRGLKAKRATAQLAAFDSFCRNNEVLPITDAVIVRAADMYADLHVRGQLIPDADILIAATAIENGLVVATNNTADFGRIAALRINNWLASDSKRT